MPHMRRDERRDLKRLLDFGEDIQMLAPRRIGKTWLMRKIMEDLDAEGWQCFFVDAEGMSSEEQFLHELCRKIEARQDLAKRAGAHLWQRINQFLGGSGEGGTLLQALGKLDPRRFAEALIEALDSSGNKTVILVDEISLFVLALAGKDGEATKTFLYHLRKLRQEYKHVHWLMTGSIGLDVVARRLDLQGAQVDMTNFPLAPFDDAAARSYLASPSLPTPLIFEDDAFAHLAGEIGWLAPFYLKLVADRIRPTGKRGNRAVVTVADAKNALDEVLQPAFRDRFATWGEHIRKNFPRDETAVLIVILDRLCTAADGETETTLLTLVATSHPSASRRTVKDLLVALQSDGLLGRAGDRWIFRSGLIRRYWQDYEQQ